MRGSLALRSATIAIAVFLLRTSVPAQWINHPNAGTPRTQDGKPNLAAPTPRASDGKPDLSGIWLPKAPTIMNLTPGAPAPFQPWAEALYNQRLANPGIGDPRSNCLPPGLPAMDLVPDFPIKIVQSPGLLVLLYENYTMFRQIFTDGREPSKEANPGWMGYSTGKWEGDSLVVEVTGFNDRTWLDVAGHPHSDALHLTERFLRKDFGHMEVDITIDDPKTYTRPWRSKAQLLLDPDTELIEFICNENEKDSVHIQAR
jgi:hypothetical protein